MHAQFRPLQRQHQSQRHGHADAETHPVDFPEDVFVCKMCIVGLAKMADAEEDDNDPQGAAWDDDVETDPPLCVVRNGAAQKWAQGESHALDAAGNGAEDRAVFQRRGMGDHTVRRG
jgi:hypothetical protein